MNMTVRGGSFPKDTVYMVLLAIALAVLYCCKVKCAYSSYTCRAHINGGTHRPHCFSSGWSCWSDVYPHDGSDCLYHRLVEEATDTI